MSEQPDIVKTNIIDYCKEDNIKCTDISAENPNFLWILNIGGTSIVVYKLKKLPDRIYVESQIKFSPEHTTLFNETWNPQQKNDLLLKLQTLAVQLNVNLTFLKDRKDKNIVTTIKTDKIHFHSTVSKAHFLELFNRMSMIHSNIKNQVSLALNVGLVQTEQQTKSDEFDNPAVM